MTVPDIIPIISTTNTFIPAIPPNSTRIYDDEVLDTFLKKQTQLFSEEVADTPEAAEEFLEDCMAVVCKNIKEVRDYFDEAGSDISGMSDDELMDQSEVFAIADGRFLVVEG